LEERRTGRWRTLILILVNLLSLGSLVWTLRDAKLGELKDDLAAMDWSWVAIAVAADIAVYVWHGLRWGLLLHPVVPIPLARTVRAIYVGLFANEVLPFRAGELLRCYLLTRWTSLPFSVSIASALIERLFDGIWMYLCLLLALQMVMLPPPLRHLDDAAYLLGVLVLIGAVVLGVALFQRHMADPFLHGAPWKRRVAVLLDDLALMGHSRYLARAFVQSLPYLLLQVVPIWASFRGYGLDLSVSAAFVLMLFLRLGTAIPSAPGNLGLFQLLTKECLQHLFQVPADEAARFSLVLWGIVTLPLLTAGFVALAVTGARIGELRKAAAAEALKQESRVRS
jgi:hypothetical protein